MDKADANVEKVMQDMVKNGHRKIAAGIERLRDALVEEGEEPIKADSLRGLANLLDLLKPQEPELGVGPDGLVQAYWKRVDNGSLAIEFLDDKDVRFSVLYGGRFGGGGREHSLTGTMPLAEAVDVVGGHMPTGMARERPADQSE